MVEVGHALVASGLACAAVLLLMLATARRHRRLLAQVPVRVHVAGSRGKTSTARLIGAGLTAGGMRTVVKTSGTEPAIVLPDGGAEPFPRAGPPSISELTRFFRTAVALRADAVVIESMAIAPEYLWASEHYLVRATHVVVTNLRPDHEEVLGDGRPAMAAAAGLVMPRNGRVFLTAESLVPPIEAACASRASAVEVVPTQGSGALEVNRRLALAVCAALGVAEEVAGPAMDAAASDPGAFFVAELDAAHGLCRFANAFACNDTTSFLELWAEHRPVAPPLVLLNARPDRPLRTRSFLAALADVEPPVRLVLSGGVPTRWALAAGFARPRVSRVAARSPVEALAELCAVAGPGGVIWGVGNYSGLGAQLVGHLRSRSDAC